MVMATNYKQIYAIRKANEEKIRKLCPKVTENSGIYAFWRIDENGFKFAYVGQALHICQRLVDHMTGYQHIDLSIKKHKLYDEETNPHGYHIELVEECSQERLDERERFWIKRYADLGYQLRNKTLGGQDGEKSVLSEGKSTKSYRDGLAQGHKNTQKEIAKLFEKNLTYEINGKPNKNKQKAYDKFTDFLNENKTEDEV